jgi:hypothetical protein
MHLNGMTYKKLPAADVNRLIDWAEEHDVDWDIWDAFALLSGADTAEIGLEQWPEDSPSLSWPSGYQSDYTNS